MNTLRSTPNIKPEDPDDPVQVFRKRFYPQINDADWDSWQWQMQNRLRDLNELEKIFTLTVDEKDALSSPDRHFPVSLTPYYAALLGDHPEDPLRKTMLPSAKEFIRSDGEYRDPLGEDKHSPVPGLVHRYPDRALILMTDHCPVYCRYCTRSRLVGGNADFAMTRRRWQQGIDYIAGHPEIHDVLISGGDPLIYKTEKLAWLLEQLHRIEHLDYIRIGTKVPVVMPQRIDQELCDMLKQFHPLFLSLHVNHPNELTDEFAGACRQLADAGIPIGTQTVLLKGVNDDIETLKTLFRGLLRNRIRPYYLLQCDPIEGSAHFRTPLDKGTELIRLLRGRLSGYGIPHFIVDLPDGGGKIALEPDYLQAKEGKSYHFESDRDGRTYTYRD